MATLNFLTGLCGYVWVNILTLLPPSVHVSPYTATVYFLNSFSCCHKNIIKNFMGLCCHTINHVAAARACVHFDKWPLMVLLYHGAFISLSQHWRRFVFWYEEDTLTLIYSNNEHNFPLFMLLKLRKRPNCPTIYHVAGRAC